MTKRILMMILALLLCCFFAHAEETLPAAAADVLYRIVLRTEEGDQTLGSGVLFMRENVLLTAAGCVREGQLYAVGADGEHQVVACELVSDSGAALLELATSAAAETPTLSSGSLGTNPQVLGADASGGFLAQPLTRLGRTMYCGQEALLLSAGEGLLPGAVVLDAQGQVLCLVLAQQTEGRGMYTALTADTLYSALTGQKNAEAFLPVQAAWEEGRLCVTWEDETQRDGGVYLVSLSADENAYYTSYEVDPEEHKLEVQTPPGHTYYVQVQWAESVSQGVTPVWSAMQAVEAPDEAFASYAYTQECYLASAPARQSVSGVLPPLSPVTTAALEDAARERYLQVRCAYDVSDGEKLPMTVELIAPDGQFFFVDLSFTFSAEHEAQDGIAVPVDSLFAGSAQFSGGSVQPGSYVLRYAFQGKTAGECVLTVETATATSGFASGLKAEEENGLVTLTWDGASIPEGASVTAYFFYEGNSYYTYSEVEAGTESMQLLAVPGRAAMAWVAWSAEGGEADLTPASLQDMLVIDALEKQPVTQHGFTNMRLSVTASLDGEAGAKGQYLPEQPITRSQLSDSDMHFYFQTEDTYQISETSSDHPLAVVLCTPDGQCFVNASYYIFDASLQASDLWLMDITRLFTDHAAMAGDQAWPAGLYTVLYCIDGQIAGEYAFTLE